MASQSAFLWQINRFFVANQSVFLWQNQSVFCDAAYCGGYLMARLGYSAGGGKQIAGAYSTKCAQNII
ncbi:MAG: hypothetical protein ACI4BH_00780 [Muribaculaceae bacterium]